MSANFRYFPTNALWFSDVCNKIAYRIGAMLWDQIFIKELSSSFYAKYTLQNFDCSILSYIKMKT